MLKVALMNLKRYNEGELVFEWVQLPQDNFKFVFDKIGHDEFIICDFECEINHIEISEHENLQVLNNLARKYEKLDRGEKIILQAIVEAETTDLSKAFEILENECYVFYEAENFIELAEQFVEKYLVNNIEKELEKYIRKIEVEAVEPKKPKYNKSKIKAEIDRLNKMYQKGRIEDDEYDKEYESLSYKLLRYDEITEERDLKYLKSFLESDFKTIYKSLTKEEQRSMWRSIIKNDST